MIGLKKFYRQHVVTVTFLFFLIVSIAMVAIVYLQPNKILSGADYHFHMNRVENLALSIKHGDFFPKISYFFIGGMGYARESFLSRYISLSTSYFKSARACRLKKVS
ncbi:hypothetical protein QY880_05675 [Latilactobacillus sakei]